MNVKEFVRTIVKDYTTFTKESSVPPWTDAFYTIVSLTEIDQNLDELLSDEMAYRLSDLGTYYYPKVKEIWDSFTNEEKIEALDGIISGIASFGLKELLRHAAEDILKWRGPSEKEKAVKAAKEFLSGKIDFNILAYRIIEALWPTPEERTEHDADVEGFWKGVELSDYVSENKLKEIVKEDFLNALEPHGSKE